MCATVALLPIGFARPAGTGRGCDPVPIGHTTDPNLGSLMTLPLQRRATMLCHTVPTQPLIIPIVPAHGG